MNQIVRESEYNESLDQNPKEWSRNKREFIQLCETHIKREGISELLDWLEKSDFYVAPASTRFHGSYKGGLVQHSLNVYYELKHILEAYPEVKCSDETAAIISLFHDLCKVNFYSTEKRNRKNEFGQWESYDAFKVDEKYHFGGHGSKSVYLVQFFMRLTPEEAAAINSHMGAWQDERVGDVYEQFPLAFLLSMADQAASYLIEPTQDK